MEDDELAAIRARRMAEMKQAAGGGGGGGFGGLPAGLRPGSGGPSGPGGGGNDQEKARQADEMRRGILHQILDSAARERLARIKMVKEDKGRAVEDLLIRMAQTGQLGGKVGENQLIQLLDQINATASETKIVYNRRRADDDSDD
ncbi:DNA-binding TFAR19-related protein, partial [Caulochytrium protostelioides]